MALFPPLDKRDMCDKVKGLLGHFGEIYRGAGRAMPRSLASGGSLYEGGVIYYFLPLWREKLIVVKRTHTIHSENQDINQDA